MTKKAFAMIPIFKISSRAWFLLVFLSWICLQPSVVSGQNSGDQTDALAAYNAAIYDASVYKFSNLRPLNPLRFDSSTKTILVVTLTDRQYTIGELKLKQDLWVTAVPEVRTMCQKFSGDLELRLKQLLGIPPSSHFTNFVTMTVKEGAIFRPTANPDPTSVLPCSCPVTNDCGESFPSQVSDDHVRWMADQMLRSYKLSESPLIRIGYPWTRLGYTYNWRPGSDKYGASEYVIREGAVVSVTEVTPFIQYCRTN